MITIFISLNENENKLKIIAYTNQELIRSPFCSSRRNNLGSSSTRRLHLTGKLLLTRVSSFSSFVSPENCCSVNTLSNRWKVKKSKKRKDTKLKRKSRTHKKEKEREYYREMREIIKQVRNILTNDTQLSFHDLKMYMFLLIRVERDERWELRANRFERNERDLG